MTNLIMNQLNQDQSLSNLQKIPDDLLQQITVEVKKHIDQKISLLLIGSWGRDEGSAFTDGSKIIPISDIEFYFICESKPVLIGKKIFRIIKKILPQFDVDISGNTYDKFKYYDDRLWLYDMASCAKVLIGIPVHLEVINKFNRLQPKFDEVYHLVLNHYIVYLNDKKNINQRIKVYNAISGLILKLINRYESRLSDRMNLLNDQLIVSKIIKLNIPYVDIQLINKVNISLGLKLGIHNINNVDNLILEDFENVKNIMISILDNHNSEPINYQQWIFKNKNVLVEWIKSFKNHPKQTFKYLTCLLPPRFFVYKKVLTNSKISNNTFHMWTIFCKGA